MTVSTGRFRDAENRRFLSRMPIFQADEDLPDRFRDLLARLDAAERGRSSHHR